MKLFAIGVLWLVSSLVNCVISADSCGGFVNGKTGTVAIPENYTAGDNCTWTFNMTKVYLAVNSFALDQQDRVIIQTSKGSEIATLSGNKDPFLVYLPSPNATLTYVSANLSRPELSLSYSQTECKLSVAAPTSTLRAPIYPMSTKAEVITCSYSLHIPDNTSDIALSFTSLSFSKAVLDVRDGNSSILSHLNGSDPHPGDVLSSGPDMTMDLQLHTGHPNSFLAAFSASNPVCTGVINLEDDPFQDVPEIMSPNYPNPYENNLDCRFIIKTKPGSTIKVEMLDLDLAPETDTLIIHDGDSRSSRALARYQQGSSFAGFYLTRSNVLWLRFLTDESETGRGFKLSVRVQKYGSALLGNGVINIARDNSSNITVPDEVFYQLYAPEKQQVSFTIGEASLLPLSAVYIHDGLQTTDPLLATVSTRDYYHGVPIVSSSNQLLVVLQNFSSSELTANIQDVIAGSYYPLTASSGSLDFSRVNWTGEEIRWTVAPRSEDGITVFTFNTFSLPDKSTLSVYSGVARYKLLLQIQSDTSFVPTLNVPARSGLGIYLSSNEPNMTDSYDSVENVTLRNVQISASYSSQKSCSDVFDSDSGTFRTPGYPGFYPYNAECGWRFKKTGKLLHVAFSDYQVANNQTVDIYTVQYVPMNHTEGNSTVWVNVSVPSHLARYEGQAVPSDVITDAPEVTVNFSSQSLDNVGVARGFQGMYQAADCGGNITNRAVVATPGFPKLLTNDVTCVWVVSIPARPAKELESVNVITFSLQFVKYVKQEGNSLVVRDGDSYMDPVIDIKEGHAVGLLSRTNKLWIEYKYKHSAANSSPGFAFQLLYGNHTCDKAHQCGNGVCLHADWICNGVDDCGDGTDEKNCRSTTVNQGFCGTAMALGCIGMLILGVVLAFVIPAVYRRIKYPNYRELRDLMVPAPT